MGVDGVIVDENKRCPLTPTVSRTSAGALELSDVYCTPNPANLFDSIKKDGWTVLAAMSPSSSEVKGDKSTKDQTTSANPDQSTVEETSNQAKTGKTSTRKKRFNKKVR